MTRGIQPNCITPLKNKVLVMKHADKPFIGILIITIAILYGVIAMLS